ncbi:hypothetical protein TNCV_2006051 [Trichonephila clavipes]|nr:hypothetical protein TNCV_2006051 [Trichonephila clavipes]
MDCLVAITDKLNADALIPPALYESLCSINDKNNKKENEIFAESADSSITFSNDENEVECGKDIFYVESDSDNINFNSDYTKMKDEQNTCDSLKTGVSFGSLRKIGDRAPITPIVRPELPFEIVNIDVIGPIQPPSGRGHKYVLCMMDQHTRWPEAVPLRSLTAKNACDSLLQIFSRTGIPSVIASDQGTNFKSALTQEFTKRIGSSPRFSCPGYPASNGLVERWNKREARGPLAILKSSWAGEIHLPTNISQSAADYLQEMKINMEKAAESASLTAAQKQKGYGDYFNKRSSVKNFSIGEQVVLLIPDSSNKIYARWTGPGEIIQHHPPHSYKVKLPDGTVRHVHVNKIRKYHPRALAVGVIFEAKVGTHRIRLKPNIERKKPFVYRIPESLKIKVDEQIEELLRLDLIEESDAEIAYPIVCVNKKDGTLRLCVDFRALNSESVSDDFPMEDAVELIHSIGRANIITTLDLLKGIGLYPWLKTAKILHLSRLIGNSTVSREFSRAYIDDIAIFSKNWEEHLFHLDTILTKLSELNFTVNLKKCAFGKAQIKYLGHIIGSVARTRSRKDCSYQQLTSA